jgi:DNA-binding beta-propeller fold protein YncE
MLKLPVRLALSASAVGLFVAVAASLALAATPTPSFDTTIGPPPATKSFDIGFVKNDIATYILADRTNNAVDLFNASTLKSIGAIGSEGFVGLGPADCAVPHACAGPNGDLIDNNNHVWAADGAASNCSTSACRCFTGETTSMVKEYQLEVSTGATGRLACLDTGGKFRADEMAFDPRDGLLIVANDADNFLSLINTTGTPSIVNQFFYADNDIGKPASAPGIATPGGGIEQPVWNPKQGFFYQALPQGDPKAPNSVGRIDVFNPKPGKLVFLRSIAVPGCDGGPTGLALNNSGQFLGACGNGVALVDANNGSVRILGKKETLGGADEIWFDSASNAWYVSTPGQLGVVSAAPGNSIQDVPPPAGKTCCGHSVAAFASSTGHTFIFDPNSGGTGISVFSTP